jgi:hypothetical protein
MITVSKYYNSSSELVHKILNLVEADLDSFNKYRHTIIELIVDHTVRITYSDICCINKKNVAKHISFETLTEILKLLRIDELKTYSCAIYLEKDELIRASIDFFIENDC